MEAFREHHPELKGFSAYYAANIFPYLEQGEKQRARAQAKANWLVFLSVTLGTILALALLGRGVNLIVVAIMGFVGVGWIGNIRSSFYKPIQLEVKDLLVGGVCRYLGWSFSESFEESSALEKFSAMGLIPQRSSIGYTRASFEDHISGEARGYDFELFEARLEREGRGDNSLIFQGQLISLGLKKPVSSTTILLPNGFWYSPYQKGKLKRVGIVDPVFEHIFTAYGTDQVEARVLLSPDIIQACVDLEASVEGRNIRFGFTDETLLIAMETEDGFEIGALAEHLTFSHRTHQIVEEIGAIFDLLDAIGNIDRG